MALKPFTGDLDPAPAAPALQPFTGELDPVKGQGGGTLQNISAGIARGAKDVIDTGAQLLASGFDKIAGTKQGEMVQAMNKAGTTEFDKAYGGSTAASVGRVGGQVLATLPVGGVLGAGARAAGAGALGDAIATGGLQAQGAGLATRALGGAIQGGAAAGLVNPDEAATGAAIGAAVPLAARALGSVGGAIGRTIRGPDAPEGVRAAAQAGAEAGYVVPPTQVNPSLANRVLEGAAGKISTAQNASARNQEVTNRLAREAIGAADLTPEGLAAVRQRANTAYDTLGRVGAFQADDSFRAALQKAAGTTEQMAKDFPELRNAEVQQLVEGLASRPEFSAQPTIEAIKQLRFNGAANRAAMDPAKKALGSAQMKVAGALEDLIDRNLERTGAQDLLGAYRDARQTLAKTYDIEKALNPASGNVDAAKLAALLKKGRPLSGELRQAAEFGSSFPKAVQTPERMGSLPQVSPLDFAAAGGIGAVTGSPLALAGLVARPAARAAVLSGPIQRSLARAPQPSSLAALALSPEAAGRLGRAAPVALTGPDR